MKTQIITEHGREKFKDRVNLPLKAMPRQATLALERGLTGRTADKQLKEYIINKLNRHKETFVVIYARKVFVFNRKDLAFVTVHGLPRNLWIHEDISKKNKAKAEKAQTMPNPCIALS